MVLFLVEQGGPFLLALVLTLPYSLGTDIVPTEGTNLFTYFKGHFHSQNTGDACGEACRIWR